MTQPVSRGDRIREARLAIAAKQRKTVSQQGMADLLTPLVGRQIHQPQVSSWEAESEPPLDVIAAYAKLSGLERDYLAWGDTPVGETLHGIPAATPMTVAEAKDRDEDDKKAERKPGRRKTG